MSNRVNNYLNLLEIANKELEKDNCALILKEEDGVFDLDIRYDKITDHYAENYFEDELSVLINEAWAHARAKIEQLNVYNAMARRSGEMQASNINTNQKNEEALQRCADIISRARRSGICARFDSDMIFNWLENLQNDKKPTYGDLKNKLNDTLMKGLVNIVNDQTLNETKLDQMRWMIFNYLTDLYWDNANDNAPLKLN